MLRKVILTSTSTFLKYKSQFKMSTLMYKPIGYKFAKFENKNKFTNNNSKQGNKQQQLKQQSKQFYNNYVQKIVQLKSSADFQQLIANINQPIILDLYADWCQPCKILTPRLEKKVNSIEKIKMIKVNIDKCSQIAHALQVKSVPTVYLIFKGQAVDRFQGNPSQNQFNRFFQTLNKLTGDSPEMKEAIEALQVAKGLMAQKKFVEAGQMLQKFKQKKVSIDLIAIKTLLLCQCYATQGKVSKFKDNLAKASQYESFIKQVPDLAKFYEVMQQALKSFQKQTNQDPQISRFKQNIDNIKDKDKRLESKLELAQYYKDKQLMQNAIQTALQIIKQDKNWQEKRANQLVLQIFKQLGNSSTIVQKYRKVLQRILS